MNSPKSFSDPATRFLMAVHDAVPGITEAILSTGETVDGRSSYEVLAEAGGPLDGKTVVDLACGSGCLSQLLAERVGRNGQVVGVDLNGSELELARVRLARVGNVRLLQESADCLSLEDTSIDVVFCHMALMLFQPLSAALMEIVRILRPGGTLAAVIPTLNGGNGTYAELRAALATQVEQDLTPEKRIVLGDAEAGTVDGLKNLLRRNGGFNDNLVLNDLTLIFASAPELLAARLLPFFYHSHRLSDAAKRRVQAEWTAILQREQRCGMVEFCLPLAVLTVTKHDDAVTEK